jgi:hypothetical protein
MFSKIRLLRIPVYKAFERWVAENTVSILH